MYVCAKMACNHALYFYFILINLPIIYYTTISFFKHVWLYSFLDVLPDKIEVDFFSISS